MTKMLLHIFKLSVLLLLAPQSQSSVCPQVCNPDAAVSPARSLQAQSSGIEVDFPLVQTIILDL